MSSASEMVERMARKLFERLAGDPDWNDAYETRAQAAACDDDDISQEECLDLARAAIEEMRTPTTDMIEAGAKPFRHHDTRFDSYETGVSETWDAMIDAALSTPQTQGERRE